REAPLAPAHVGHDAEGAEAVAATHHGDPSAHAALTRDGEVGIGLGRMETEGHVRVAVAAAQQLGQAAVAVGPYQHVDPRRALGELGAQMLRHAAGDTETDVGPAPLEARELAQAAEDARLGVLADGA